jgi:hypothetical protein
MTADDVNEIADGLVGSAVVGASRPVAVVASGERPGSDRYAYEGFMAGAATLFAPMVLKERDGWSTGIQVQNIGASPATVQVVYVGSAGGRWFDTVELLPFGSATLYQPAHPALPTGFAGAAVISSASGQQLAALVIQARGNGATMAYAAATGGTERLDAPVLFKRYNGWDSALQLFNLGGTVSAAMITYMGGQQPVWDNTLLQSGTGTTVTLGSSGLLPDGFVGSATVQGLSGSRLAGIVTEFRSGSMAAMSYSASGTPGTALFVPHIMRGDHGWTSGIEVQNPGNGPAPVVVMIYDQHGNIVQRVQDTIQPGATCNFYLAAIDGIPDGFRGSAIVQSLSGQPVIAVVNEVAR